MNGTQTTYTYGSYNRLLSAGSTSYTYDPNGNMITKTSGSTSWSYSYDYENRLKQVTFNALSVFQAAYDGDGRRVQTISGDTTVYDYLPGSWNPAYVKDLTTDTGTDVIFADGLLISKMQGAATSYYHLDRLGSVRLVTKQSTALSFQTSYQPYGALSATSGTETFHFTGKQLDSATGLYYYGLRYYDSQSGRFMSQDPVAANGGNPQSLDRYVYALDNPLVNVDPTGAMDLLGGLPAPYHQPIIHTPAPPTPEHFAPTPGTDQYTAIQPGNNMANQPTAPATRGAPSSSTGPPIGSTVTGEPTSGPGSTPPAGWSQVSPGTWRFTGVPKSPVESGPATPSRQFVALRLLLMKSMTISSMSSMSGASASSVGSLQVSVNSGSAVTNCEETWFVIGAIIVVATIVLSATVPGAAFVVPEIAIFALYEIVLPLFAECSNK